MYSSENVIPKDIEEIIHAHSSVTNVAVVGVPHAKWGESVVAFVQGESSSKSALNEKELKAWLRNDDFAPHKMPDHFFITSEETGLPSGLPVNASGTVLKTGLRQLAQNLVAKGGKLKLRLFRYFTWITEYFREITIILLFH
ncbi:putative acyl-CoA synthetase YngI [Talaromyces pinophilus]|nr:putative acyl-CoA synthetase YngI [Talaromyces pinophilus]